MTADRIRIRRLSRLAARARAAVVQAEQGLSDAARAAAEAAARRAALDQFLTETRPQLGTSGADALLAGAQLRRLLAPAAQSAAQQQASAADSRRAAEQRLRTASARADGLSDRLLEARRLMAAEAERRTSDLTPLTPGLRSRR
jgi:hypothetical protein